MGWQRGAAEKTNEYYQKGTKNEENVSHSKKTVSMYVNRRTYERKNSSKNNSNKKKNSKSNSTSNSSNNLKCQENIKKEMNNIVRLMKQGKSMEDACKSLGIDKKLAKQWYDKGWFGDNSFYKDFYEKVKELKYQKKKPKTQSTRKQRSTNVVKNKSGSIKRSKSGLSAGYKSGSKTGSKSGPSAGYKSGSKSGLSTTSKPSVSYDYSNKNVPKSITSNKLIKCPKCGKYYKSNTYHKCETKPVSLPDVRYCQNCGKKITSNDLYYCSECGASLKDGKKSVSDKSNDWMKYVLIIFFILIAIVFFGLF